MLTQRTTAFRRQMQGDDSGFSLIEVVVALVVLMVFAGALSVTLLNSLGVSKAARQRVAAGNLAARELEIVRNKFASSDVDAIAVAAQSTVINGNPVGAAGPSYVDGTPYTVRRDVQWLPTGTGVSACDGGALVNSPALQVVVTVTWPNMRTARPVIAETVMTPLKGTLDNVTTAYIAIKIQAADGTAADGVPATATGPGGTFVHSTDASGCVVFQVGAAGNYSVTLNTAGWVDQTGAQVSVKTPITAAAGTMVRASMTYDLAASMDVTLASDGGYPLPAPLPAVNYIKPNVATSLAQQTFTSLTTTTHITGLWPTNAGYAAWSGGCPDSDPAASPTSGSRAAPVVIAPGANGNLIARLAPVLITVKTAGGKPIQGLTLTATSAATTPSACGVGVYDRVLTLQGTTDGSGNLKASLPFGKWTLNTNWNNVAGLPAAGVFPATPDPFTPAGTPSPFVNAEPFQVN
jgi:prepilin-type N-terminal cleavage/methylation domain-containing protein